MTAFNVDAIPQLNLEIEGLRQSAGMLPHHKLKAASKERPEHLTPILHMELKKQVLKSAAKHGAVFFAYAKFNEKREEIDAKRNTLFGLNTVFGKFDGYLLENNAQGIALVDRIDFKNSFDYLREKFRRGNYYKATDDWKPLRNILSYGMTCEGASHLASVNDVITGSFRYLVNDTQDERVRSEILALLKDLMWKDKAGRFDERGFTLRPYVRTKLARDVVVEYDYLRSELNRAYKNIS